MPKAVREALGLAAVVINSLLGEDYGTSLPVDVLGPARQDDIAMDESAKQFSFTSVVSSTIARTESEILLASNISASGRYYENDQN